jgi:hypothetical protein
MMGVSAIAGLRVLIGITRLPADCRGAVAVNGAAPPKGLAAQSLLIVKRLIDRQGHARPRHPATSLIQMSNSEMGTLKHSRGRRARVIEGFVRPKRGRRESRVRGSHPLVSWF